MGAQYGVRSDPIERAASPLRLLAVLADDVVVGPATRLAASTVQFVREASRGSEESSNERRTSQWAAQEVRQGRWPLQQPLLHTAPAVANVHAVSNAFAQVMKTASRVGASVRRNPFTAPSAAPSAAPSTPTRLHLHSAFGFSERAPRRVSCTRARRCGSSSSAGSATGWRPPSCCAARSRPTCRSCGSPHSAAKWASGSDASRSASSWRRS